MSYVFLNWSD